MYRYTDNLNILKQRLSNLVGEVTTKNLFSGFGFFKNKLMFGLFLNDVLYLKAKDEVASYIVDELGGASCLAKTNETHLSLSHYYRLPIDTMRDDEQLKNVVLMCIQQATQHHLDAQILKKNRIKELSNLSIKHERLLAKIEVYDVKSFKERGAVNCFVALKKAEIPVSLTIYWELVGALASRHPYVLPKQVRIQALIDLNEALEKENLKPIKSLLLEEYYKNKQ
ncbi:TfoX/Sxy family DNA transformation protein [Actinobacillus delphinicola]|uniref:Competence-specific genes regulator n=1 Tax=Actinobacillus delphinicola TaxID=51161 RepID=A0A448TTG1_9PAST|nr:TfoX/Sxy family DNA transformation protein [Actinobacillus delphinicola]VEJ09294.1 competence-specific genes regulator [Actinobacillus delphinicola]